MAEGTGSYDIVILGGGSGGYACALRAAELGQRVALIEKDKVGGTCLHRGCIPTKALLHAAEIADQSRESAKFGVKTTFEGIDVPSVQRYKDSVVDRLWKGPAVHHREQEDRHHRGLGPARIARPRSGSATPSTKPSTSGAGHRVGAPQPPGPGDRRHPGHHLRRRAQAGPGARVGGHPGRRGDRGRVRQRVAVLRRRGDDRGDAPPAAAAGGRDQRAGAAARVPAPRHPLRAGQRLRIGQAHRHRCRRHPGRRQDARRGPAAGGGRSRPGLPDLGYAETGVAIERGYVKVDPLCRTSVPTISAVGDLINTPQLAHVGFAEGIMVAERVAGLDVTPIDYDGVPGSPTATRRSHRSA